MNDGSVLEQLVVPGALTPLFQPIFDIAPVSSIVTGEGASA